jgi:DNA-binding transcriptional LysR family regulator
LELGHLHTFVAVAEERSISRAARRLFTTPSAVSMQVKALETELSVQLFVRTSRGVELTDIGRQIKEKAQLTLQSAKELADYATETQQQISGRAALGLNATSTFLRVSSLIEQMSASHPTVELQVVKTNTSSVLEDVKRGKLDMGFVFGEVHDPALEIHKLYDANLVIIAPIGWESRIANVDWAELAQMPWIYADGYCPFQSIIDGIFEARGLSYKRFVLSNDETTKVELVAAGLGLALLEESEARAAHDRVIIYDTPTIPCTLSLAYLARRRREPLIKALRQHILALWER